MKLIDLLVKELPSRGGWPDFTGKLQVVQDDDREIKFHTVGYKLGFGLINSGRWGSDTHEAWLDSRASYDRNFHSKELSDDYDSAIVTREQYEASVWNGEGLPPVGTECEVLHDNRHKSWLRVRIIAHDDKRIIGRWIEGPKVDQLFDYPITRFRPIRSEAERKRDEFLSYCNDKPVNTYAELYDDIAAHKITGVTIVPTVGQIVRVTEKCSREDAERIVTMLTGGTITE